MSLIIKVARNDLYSGIAALQNVTNKKGTIAILANVLIETSTDSVVLTATDLEIGMRIEIAAEILSPGSITLPSRKLFEITRETADDHIKIEILENNWSQISTESGDYKLAGADSEEFPSFPEFDNEILSTVPSDALKEIIEKTIFSVAQDGETQFNLTGGLFEKGVRDGKNYIRFVSSDGHRLSFMEREIDTDVSRLNLDKTILIPRKGIMEIAKLCEKNDFIEIGFDSKQAVLKTSDTVVIIRLLNGDFPDYKNIINAIKKENFIEIDRLSFLSSMKRINLFTEDLFNSVQFSFTEGLLELSSQNMDIGSANEELEVSYSGEELTLGFNGKYFIDALNIMSSDKVKAYLNSEKSPCLIEGDDDPGFMGVIMPMKI